MPNDQMHDADTTAAGPDDPGPVAETASRVAIDKTVAAKLEADTADVRMSAVGYLVTDSANLKMSPTAVTYARGSADMKLSSANMLLAGQDVAMQYSGAQLVGAKGSVDVTMGAAGAILTREAHVDRGLVGLLVAGDVELGEGAKVMLRPAGAAALGAGFAGGLLLAVAFLWRLFAAGIKRRSGGDGDDD